MITIYLIRHGEAENFAQDSHDASRLLTQNGSEDIASQAQYLKTEIDGLKQIQHSGFVRAKQTAQVLGEHLSAPLLENNLLRPSGSIAKIKESLMGLEQTIILVSHLPLIQDLARDLTGEIVRFHPGTLVKLQREDPYRLRSMIRWVRHPHQNYRSQ